MNPDKTGIVDYFQKSLFLALTFEFGWVTMNISTTDKQTLTTDSIMNMDIALLILIETLKEIPEVEQEGMLNWTINLIASQQGVNSLDLKYCLHDWRQGRYTPQCTKKQQ